MFVNGTLQNEFGEVVGAYVRRISTDKIAISLFHSDYMEGYTDSGLMRYADRLGLYVVES